MPDSGHLDPVLPLYAPDAVAHGTDGDRRGRAAVVGQWDEPANGAA